MFLHGGGWISGGLDTNQRLCALLAAETERTVVAVDYRLAPEHRYPAALRDCERVLDWIAASGPEHGLDAGFSKRRRRSDRRPAISNVFTLPEGRSRVRLRGVVPATDRTKSPAVTRQYELTRNGPTCER
ncbi:MAG: alpha/beta hydrolase fold domain-containing protein [Haloferacaceae archaeon]